MMDVIGESPADAQDEYEASKARNSQAYWFSHQLETELSFSFTFITQNNGFAYT